VTLLAALVDASEAVAATRSRTAKVGTLAEVLSRLADDEVEAAVGILTGTPRQGRIGVGWRTLAGLPPQPAAAPSLSVGDVDASLTALGGTAGSGSAARRRAALEGLLHRATGPEDGMLRRLLTGELRQGALEGMMAEAVAQASGVPATAVRRAAMLSGDLGATAAAALTGGADALADITLEVMRPVQPMLAAGAADVGEALVHTGEASVEWKLDGARIQVHRVGDEVRVFTRNLNEVTQRVPGVVARVREMPASRLVLDGEVVGLDDAARPKAFQQTMSSFGRRRDDVAGSGLGAWFFDVLHHDGDDLIDVALAERLARLDAVAGGAAIPRRVTSRPEEAEAMLEQALAAGHEGIVVKAMGSTYDAGRRGGSWRKVKPVRTLDLVVLAAEWGHGRRRGWLSNLHLGAREAEGGRFVMVGKTFKGLTDELLAWQTEALLELEIERYDIEVRVRPQLVVEVAFDGAQVSTRYPGGVALRFARVRRYRHDKEPAEADTIGAVRAALPESRSV
jgi:DNA ligase 1